MSLFRNFYDIAGWISSLERRVSALERLEELTVAAKYRRTTAQSISNATETIVDYATQEYDTHSAVTTGASWKFTAPINGYYHVDASVGFTSSNTWAETEYILLQLFYNGTVETRLARVMGLDTSGGAEIAVASGSDTIYLDSSDYIDIQVYQTSGGALNLSDGLYNYVAIERVG